MKWIELTVHTTSECADLVADLLFESGGNGVAISDRADVLEFMKNGRVWDYIDERVAAAMSDVVLVKGFVPVECYEEKYGELKNRLEQLRQNAQGNLNCGSLEILTREIDDEDWVNIWKKHYKPIHLKIVVICPKWIDYQPVDGETVVLMDPGMAFGTGEHETTSMCIELMQEYPVAGKDVIDVGCGSGILGITAVKLAAKSVFMTDIDPVAITAAGYNAELNGVKDRLTLNCQNLLDRRDVTGDLLLINIVAEVLIDLSRDIRKHINPGGTVILSGIIRAKEQAVIDAYQAIGLTLDRQYEKGEWAALAFRL